MALIVHMLHIIVVLGIVFAPSLILSEKMPLKHQIPVNTLLNLLCIFVVVLALVSLSVSMVRPAKICLLLD